VAAARGITVATAMSSREREGLQLQDLVNALAAGNIRVPAIEELPIARAGEGLERLKSGHVRGKIVLSLGAQDWA
jgi:D-arabinose 1-dehydrogenase-like Zn-dependent alcohol dehydrogenase